MRDRNAPLTGSDIATLSWDKMDGLLPAVVQNCTSGRVLMVGYMNREALEATLRSARVTFFSRSKQRLWQKGETSGNVLSVRAIFVDCDGDALLVLADAHGPTCHTGTTSCFGDEAIAGAGWLAEFAAIIAQRAHSSDQESYTKRLLGEGLSRIAQKVGEEGVEVALAAVTRDADGCAEEIADLLYHVTVLMHALDLGWSDIVEILRARHRARQHPA